MGYTLGKRDPLVGHEPALHHASWGGCGLVGKGPKVSGRGATWRRRRATA